MEWVRCIHCEKLQNDFMAQTCALIAPVQPICTKFRVVMKDCQMHPNTTRRTKHYALIAPVQPILYQASCSNETNQNAPKHYETQQYMSLGSNGVGRCIHCETFQNDVMAQTCALIAPVQPVLHQVSCSNETLTRTPNTTKRTKT